MVSEMLKMQRKRESEEKKGEENREKDSVDGESAKGLLKDKKKVDKVDIDLIFPAQLKSYYASTEL